MTTAVPTAPKWVLSDLYSSIADPRIDQHLDSLEAKAKAFSNRFKGKINTPDVTADTLLTAIQEYEALDEEGAKPQSYAHMVFSADTSDPDIGAFMQKIEERCTSIGIHTIFFALELLKLDDGVMQRLLSNPMLENYRHYVIAARAYKDFTLTEPEERIVEEMRTTGCRAFGRLFSDIVSNHVFKLEFNGEVEDLTEPELLDKLREPDRDLRRAAATTLTKGLAELERVLVLTFNTLLLDKATNDRLRGLREPQQSRHIANELEEETVEMVMKLCEENHPICERYYHLKRDILGLSELTHYDRYAPLFETEGSVGWESAKEMVLDSFGRFSPDLRNAALEFFDKEWIDAEPRPGKMGGAYCTSITTDLHPYVFMNYLGKMDGVLTLAHELGHGVHGSLSRTQTYLNFHSTLPLAELASTFGEMLVFDALQEKASLKDRLAMYAENIEGSFATIFRQAAMYRFEQDAHNHRRSKGELKAGELGEYWHKRQQAMFGSAVKLGEEHRSWWSYVPHFIFSPFYVYAYSFGELLVLSLYQMARDQGPGFADKYLDLLRAGGSRSPHELMSTVGIDIRSADFWRGGFKALHSRVEEFEKLWSEYKA